MRPSFEHEFGLRPELWDPRWVGRGKVRAIIEGLDPEEHDAEIVHLSMEVLTPRFLAHAGYVAAALNTLVVPRVAERIVRGGAGKQLQDPRARDHETLATFAAIIRHGHRAREGRALCAQIRRVHERVTGIANEDMLYTLGQLIFAPEELSAFLGMHIHSERELHAAFSFWCGAGRAMGLTELPSSRSEFVAFQRSYEDRHGAPSEEARIAAEAHLRGLDGWCPRPLRPAMHRLLLSSLSPRVRACLGYGSVMPLTACAARVGLVLLWRGTRSMPARLDASLAQVVPRD